MTGFWSGLPNPIFGLAPMDGVTDAAFRWMVARHGPPDVTFTEFTSVGDVLRGPDFLLNSLRYAALERPIVAQLYGKDPDLFYQAAHVVCELGFDGLDINMGCPSKNVAASGSGAALIRTPDLARRILQAARAGIEDWARGGSLRDAGVKPSRIETVATMNGLRGAPERTARAPIPLSVKTRLGYDSVVIERWIAVLLEERPVAVTVHGRTLEQMYRGAADWRAIAHAVRVAAGTPTLVLGNGDLTSLADAAARVRESGTDGALIGRGTLGRPWFFHDKNLVRGDAAHTGSEVGSPDERLSMMLEHARAFEALFGVERFPRMRKHLAWYCSAFPHAAAMRARMVRTASSRDVEVIVQEWREETSRVRSLTMSAACG